MAVLSKPCFNPEDPFSLAQETEYIERSGVLKKIIKATAIILLSPYSEESARLAAYAQFLNALLSMMQVIDDTYPQDLNGLRYTQLTMFSWVQFQAAARRNMQQILYQPKSGYTEEFFALLAARGEIAYLGVLWAFKLDRAVASGVHPLEVLKWNFEDYEEQQKAESAARQIQDSNESSSNEIKKETYFLFAARDGSTTSLTLHPPPAVPAGYIPFPSLMNFEVTLTHIAMRPAKINENLTFKSTAAALSLDMKMAVAKGWEDMCEELDEALMACPHPRPHFPKTFGVRLGGHHRHGGWQWTFPSLKYKRVCMTIKEEIEAFVQREMDGKLSEGDKIWTSEQEDKWTSELRRAGTVLRDAAVGEWVECQDGGWSNFRRHWSAQDERHTRNYETDACDRCSEKGDEDEEMAKNEKNAAEDPKDMKYGDGELENWRKLFSTMALTRPESSEDDDNENSEMSTVIEETGETDEEQNENLNEVFSVFKVQLKDLP